MCGMADEAMLNEVLFTKREESGHIKEQFEDLFDCPIVIEEEGKIFVWKIAKFCLLRTGLWSEDGGHKVHHEGELSTRHTYWQ
jgi:hypothetical protein